MQNSAEGMDGYIVVARLLSLGPPTGLIASDIFKPGSVSWYIIGDRFCKGVKGDRWGGGAVDFWMIIGGCSAQCLIGLRMNAGIRICIRGGIFMGGKGVREN